MFRASMPSMSIVWGATLLIGCTGISHTPPLPPQQLSATPITMAVLPISNPAKAPHETLDTITLALRTQLRTLGYQLLNQNEVETKVQDLTRTSPTKTLVEIEPASVCAHLGANAIVASILDRYTPSSTSSSAAASMQLRARGISCATGTSVWTGGILVPEKTDTNTSPHQDAQQARVSPAIEPPLQVQPWGADTVTFRSLAIPHKSSLDLTDVESPSTKGSIPATSTPVQFDETMIWAAVSTLIEGEPRTRWLPTFQSKTADPAAPFPGAATPAMAPLLMAQAPTTAASTEQATKPQAMSEPAAPVEARTLMGPLPHITGPSAGTTGNVIVSEVHTEKEPEPVKILPAPPDAQQARQRQILRPAQLISPPKSTSTNTPIDSPTPAPLSTPSSSPKKKGTPSKPSNSPSSKKPSETSGTTTAPASSAPQQLKQPDSEDHNSPTGPTSSLQPQATLAISKPTPSNNTGQFIPTDTPIIQADTNDNLIVSPSDPSTSSAPQPPPKRVTATRAHQITNPSTLLVNTELPTQPNTANQVPSSTSTCYQPIYGVTTLRQLPVPTSDIFVPVQGTLRYQGRSENGYIFVETMQQLNGWAPLGHLDQTTCSGS